jgi:ADP-heptose:LPS heptosyltransferase
MQAKTIRKVLIFDPNYLGDMLMSSPVMRALKENGVEQVDVVAHPFCRELLERNSFIDNIYWGYPWVEAVKARFRDYDMVMQLNTSLKTNLMLWIAGKRRLGYSYGIKGIPLNMKVVIPYRTATHGYRIRECLDLLEKGLGWECKDERMVYDID